MNGHSPSQPGHSEALGMKQYRFLMCDSNCELCLADRLYHLFFYNTTHFTRFSPANSLDSPISVLPDEVLSDIFMAFITPSVENELPRVPPHFTLCAVSAHWRRVVLSTPGLWEVFSMKVTSSNLPNTLSLLRVFSQNRRALPGSLELDMEGINISHPILADLSKAIFNASQIVSIKLHCPPKSWLVLLRKNCSTLRDLRLSWLHGPDCGAFGWSEGRCDQPPWQHLTRLSLKNTPVYVCIELLRGCPDLVHFASFNTTSRIGIGASWGQSTTYPPIVTLNKPIVTLNKPIVTLNNLRCLKWDTRKLVGMREAPLLGWDGYLLRSLQCPVLRHIAFPFPAERSSRNALSEFISEVAHQIDTFELLSAGHAFLPWFGQVLEKLAAKLARVICTGVFESTLPRILSMLERSVVQLPALYFIEILFARRESISSSLFVQPVQALAKRMKEIGRGKIRFEIDNVNVKWAGEDRASLSELKGGGFHLEVVHDGCLLDI